MTIRSSSWRKAVQLPAASRFVVVGLKFVPVPVEKVGSRHDELLPEVLP